MRSYQAHLKAAFREWVNERLDYIRTILALLYDCLEYTRDEANAEFYRKEIEKIEQEEDILLNGSEQLKLGLALRDPEIRLILLALKTKHGGKDVQFTRKGSRFDRTRFQKRHNLQKQTKTNGKTKQRRKKEKNQFLF